MAHILKIAALLSSLLIVVCATQKTQARLRVLKEIIKTLNSIDDYLKDRHHKIMVSNVFSDAKGLSESEIFCKVAKVMEPLQFFDTIEQLHKIKQNVISMGNSMQCEIDDIDDKIEFESFVNQLLKFSRKTFRTSH